jgi:hypothetical protein
MFPFVPMPESPTANASVSAAIGTAFRQNRLPCLLLNMVVVALVVSYYHWPAAAGLWDAVGAFKTRWSFVFSCVSTMFAAAVMPFGIQWLMGTLPSDSRWRKLGWRMLFWGYRGMEIDLFYRVLGKLFGHGHDAATLTTKVLIDQFVMSPLWFVPTYVIALRWIDQGGSLTRLRASLDRHFWTHTCFTVLVTNWLVWIPALALVYSLPGPLQFPLFAVVMCFFILVVTLIARDPRPHVLTPEGTAG